MRAYQVPLSRYFGPIGLLGRLGAARRRPRRTSEARRSSLACARRSVTRACVLNAQLGIESGGLTAWWRARFR